jgi:hypothetical protein
MLPPPTPPPGWNFIGCYSVGSAPTSWRNGELAGMFKFGGSPGCTWQECADTAAGGGQTWFGLECATCNSDPWKTTGRGGGPDTHFTNYGTRVSDQECTSAEWNSATDPDGKALGGDYRMAAYELGGTYIPFT